jgi:dienelactone hydrolase
MLNRLTWILSILWLVGGASRAAGASTEPSLEDWLKNRFYALTAKRDAAFEKLNGRTALRRWQEERRAFFIRRIGAFPERASLNARVTGQLRGEGYRIEKVMIESRPRHTITGNLYLPASKGPHPAILIPCGHSHNGKASGQYQRAAILFARNGMAALCYDPVGQGERYQAIDRTGGNTHFQDMPYKLAVPHPAVRHLCTTEHTLMGTGSILLGENVAQYRIWDGMRAIDYLQSRADIQANKIGCTGNSGGGTLTSYLMALDDRIKAASPGSYLTTFQKLIEVKGPQDAEQNIFGQIAFGMGASDYLIMRAPVPILICASTRDSTFHIDGARKVFEQANRFYSHLGFPERVALNEADVPHGYYIQHREAVARWMHRWLVGHDKVIWEIPRSEWPEEVTDTFLRSVSEAVWTPEQLQCSPQGQVMLMDGERSVFEINADKAKAWSMARQKNWRESSALEKRRIIRKAIGMKEPAPVRFETGDFKPAIGHTVKSILMQRTNGITLAAKLYLPKGLITGTVLLLHGEGRSDEELPLALVKQGRRVLSAELSGIGLTDVPANKRTWGYGRFGLDNQEILTAYLIGDSFVRMRVDDALSWAGYFGDTKIDLIGVGEAAIPALHAAALAPERFRQIKLQKMIRSWTEVARAPEHYNQLVNAVHGALRHYDLPDLVKLTRAEVSDPVDVDWRH